jgi:hypothetical protein
LWREGRAAAWVAAAVVAKSTDSPDWAVNSDTPFSFARLAATNAIWSVRLPRERRLAWCLAIHLCHFPIEDSIDLSFSQCVDASEPEPWEPGPRAFV